MAKAIYQSCDVYFYHFAQQLGMDVIAPMAKRCGMGEEYPLPVLSQFYGTVPDPAWKMKKYGQPWQPYDTVNATIGQGYMLANPLQLAEELGLLQQSDAHALQGIVDEVLADWPDKVAEYQSGKKGLIGLFMGEVMKRSRGSADPKIATELLRRQLD